MKELNIDAGFGSIMVLVPHQDDEVLLTAGVLYKAVEAGLPATVVMVTNGDCGCEDWSKGRTRLRETVSGCRILGLREEQLVFLGYADTGMPPEDSFVTHLFEEKDASKIYPSSCSSVTYSLEEKPEFHVEKQGEHAPYSREMLKKDLRQALEEYRPRNLFTTSEIDRHGDHSGLCRFVYEVLGEMEEEGKDTPHVYCGLVHSGAGDDRWPARGTERFDCPQGSEAGAGYLWEERFVLPLPAELRRSAGTENLKYQALLQYETALEPNAYEFLMAFVKDEEIFWKMK